MADKMLADLADTVRQLRSIPSAGLTNVGMMELTRARASCIDFVDAHHATIAQNAEAAKRLKALEQAIDEIGTTGISDADQINIRADEIMRGGE